MLHRIPPTHSASDLLSAPEQSIGKASDYKVGDKKEVKVGDATALIVCTKKGLFAVGSRCTHYGAPLEKGVLDGCRLKCPWHGAVFAVETGDVEEAPAIDALPSYPLRVDSDTGEVFVQVPQTADSKKSARKHIIPPNAACTPPLSATTFAIVGAGAAGLAAADTLRQAGFQGTVALFTRESNPPYDRTQLSKDPTKGTTVEKIYLRSKEELESMKITVHYDTTVTGVDSAAKQLKIKKGGGSEEAFKYDEVLFCTGSGARKLGVPGEELKNVFTIRAPEEAAAITNALKSLGDNKADVVIVGSGFIGMELAAFLSSKKELARSVTVVDRSATPMAKQLGTDIGRGLQHNHEKVGVKFVLQSGVEAVVDDGAGAVGGVRLKGGSVLGCQVVVVALGAVIQTDVLKSDKAVELSDDGEVIVDSHYRNKSGIYAAGDIAKWPYFAQNNKLIRVEHWAVAQQTGRAAALGMLYGKSTDSIDYVPYYWTVQTDKKSVRYCGWTGGGHDSIELDGNPADLKWVAAYIKDGTIVAVSSCQRDPAVSQAAELIRLGKMPSVEQLKEAKFDFGQFLGEKALK